MRFGESKALKQAKSSAQWRARRWKWSGVWNSPHASMIEVTAAHAEALSLAGRRMIQRDAMSFFVAIDFETANHRSHSACAVGLTAVRGGRIEVARSFLIRPPEAQFTFTEIHGLRWEDVRAAQTFGGLWPTLHAWIDDAEFIAAHNAPFDRSVLQACCAVYGIRTPRVPFICTVQLARAQWGIYPTRLSDVCRRIRIPLRHHDAGSDAEACARIVLAAQREGWCRG